MIHRYILCIQYIYLYIYTQYIINHISISRSDLHLFWSCVSHTDLFLAHPRTIEGPTLTHMLYCHWGAKKYENNCRVRSALICPHWRTDASTNVLLVFLHSSFISSSHSEMCSRCFIYHLTDRSRSCRLCFERCSESRPETAPFSGR